MTQNEEMSADLREIITCDESAQITLIYGGKTIIGTKGNLIQSGDFDRDGGGINTDYNVTATFILSDFPNTPDGTEIVSLNGVEQRLYRVHIDDFNVGIAIDFTSIVTQ